MRDRPGNCCGLSGKLPCSISMLKRTMRPTIFSSRIAHQILAPVHFPLPNLGNARQIPFSTRPATGQRHVVNHPCQHCSSAVLSSRNNTLKTGNKQKRLSSHQNALRINQGIKPDSPITGTPARCQHKACTHNPPPGDICICANGRIYGAKDFAKIRRGKYKNGKAHNLTIDK